jgi:uncharacterized protein
MIPFVFGKIAEFENFTNREDETELLKKLFKSLNNVIVISPRRWGKSSLIRHAANQLVAEDSNFKVIYIDMFNIRTEEEFYQEFASKTIKVSYSKIEDLMLKSKSLFQKLIPKISFSPIPESEVSLSFDWDEVKKDPTEILNLPQKVAESENIKLIVCFDEFQNLNVFENNLAFQKKLRANWQYHSQVAYCLYGSKENMMQTIFNDKSLPFYRFGYNLNLEKIKVEKWVNFIQKRFQETGKTIAMNEARLITEYVHLLPYYVQQLSQISWFYTDSICSKEIIDRAFEDLINQLEPFFIRETENLSSQQISFLELLLNGSQPINSNENIRKYGLNSTANIAKAQKALLDKQVIRKSSNKFEFIDPIYGVWLQKYYFTKI